MKIRIPFAIFLLVPAFAFAQVAPNLGATAPFAVLGVNGTPIPGTVTCTGPGTVSGQVGTTFPTGPTGIVNTGCTMTGPIVFPVSATVVSNFNTAFTQIDTLNPSPCTGTIPTFTTTLAPGVYCSAAGTTIGAGVTITLNGTASDVWIFRVGTGGPSALTLTGAHVVMGGTANACNVYWKTSAAATTTDSDFVGTLLSGTAISMTRGTWVGRAMATTDVTLTNPAPFTGCPAVVVPPPPPPGGPAGIPTLSEWAMFLLAGLLAISGFAAMRRRAR